MISADPRLWDTAESRRRRDHSDEPAPRVVQIAGGDPDSMADAARRNVDAGAQIIDINMGCPAKKVCNKDAGSALLRDERLVAAILEATVGAVDAPVTLKIRTGWAPDQRNAVRIARLAEACGIRALAIHGRTRACRFNGEAEYATIAAVKAAVRIPVFANGDIDTPAKAVQVLRETGADGVMIGRAAQGRPWIFREIKALLTGAQVLPAPPAARSACYHARASARFVRVLRPRAWCQDRAQTHRLVLLRTPACAGVSPSRHASGHDRSAVGDGARVFRAGIGDRCGGLIRDDVRDDECGGD